MKTFVLATCLLVFVQIIYAVDDKQINIMRNNLKECIKTVPKGVNDPKNPIKNANVWYCALTKHGIFTPQGVNVKKGLKTCEDIVVNPADVKRCKEIMLDCKKKAYARPGSIIEKNRSITSCGINEGAVELTVFSKEKWNK
ncbi:venom allergen 4 [Solenopsis invicta]|uniref:venom allergen 4 n=1 Tax=Solenopsis invicta TaxID=13686 RepID=UPI00193CC14B|nr:venom allergen 4 [Solenopsis invicta]